MQLHPVSWVENNSCVITQLKHCFVEYDKDTDEWRPMYKDVHVLEEMMDVIIGDLEAIRN
jgi:hypothetical protein